MWVPGPGMYFETGPRSCPGTAIVVDIVRRVRELPQWNLSGEKGKENWGRFGERAGANTCITIKCQRDKKP